MIESTQTNTNCSFEIPCHDTAYVVEFCPFEWSCQLIAVGTDSRVSVVSCQFEIEDEDVDGFESKQIRDFQNGCRVTALAWSPETSLSTVPRCVRFVAAGSDKKLRVFSSNIKDEDRAQILTGHRDFINSVTFDPSRGDRLASTGDDQTCRIWDKDGDMLTVFSLTSPGMTVCWHHEEPMKILVGQKNGVIRIFSLQNQQPIMSLDCGRMPLMSVDWSRHNCLIIGAVADADWLVFDTSVSSRPLESRPAYAEGASLFKWSRCHEGLLATMGKPGRQIKVFNTRHNQVHLSTSLPVAYNLTWHYRLPVIAVGGDKKVHLWLIEST